MPFYHAQDLISGLRCPSTSCHLAFIFPWRVLNVITFKNPQYVLNYLKYNTCETIKNENENENDNNDNNDNNGNNDNNYYNDTNDDNDNNDNHVD